MKSWRERLAERPLKAVEHEIREDAADNKPTNPQTPDSLRVGLLSAHLTNPQFDNKPPSTAPKPVEKEEDIYLSSEFVGQSTVGQSRDVYATRARWSLAARGYVEVTNLATGEVVEIPHREATPVWQEDIWRLRGGRDR